MVLRPFTATGLQQTLNRMKLRSASGPDFWPVADLKNLPDSIFALLPDLFSLIETTGDWPVPIVHSSLKPPGTPPPLVNDHWES